MIAAANRLPTRLAISAGPIDEKTAAHVARAFGDGELIKVRLNTDDRAAAESTAIELAARVEADFVGRVGFVAILHRSRAARENDAAP
ncbi:MAG: YhbY family RNA-binding protein [Planctomycetes bacterium]|nr:YhbY family RNA-binding protein [Planctomycetota bacterium]